MTHPLNNPSMTNQVPSTWVPWRSLGTSKDDLDQSTGLLRGNEARGGRLWWLRNFAEDLVSEFQAGGPTGAGRGCYYRLKHLMRRAVIRRDTFLAVCYRARKVVHQRQTYIHNRLAYFFAVLEELVGWGWWRLRSLGVV